MRFGPRLVRLLALGGLLALCAAPAHAFHLRLEPPGTRLEMNLDLLPTTPFQTRGYGVTTWNALAQMALGHWNAVGIGPLPDNSFFSVQTPPVTGNACARDGVNEVRFAATICGMSWGDTIGVATTYIVNGKVVEADVNFNSTRPIDAYPGPIVLGPGNRALLDFVRLALHEFGHIAGLDHPDDVGQSVTAIMNSAVAVGDTVDTLQPDDRNGARAIAWNPPDPIPVLASLAPGNAFAGGAGFTLTVTGTNLVPSSKVRWNGSERPTTFVNSTQLTATIAAADIAVPGTAQVTIVTPGGGTSGVATFTILVRLAAAVLPGSRAVVVGAPATAFVSVVNAGTATASAVGIGLKTPIAAGLLFQTTDPTTNALTGTPNTPVSIPSGGTQTFVIAVTPTAPFGPTTVEFTFAGTNAATTTTGIDTLLLSASTTAGPDIVALAATVGNNGIVSMAGASGTGVFSVATVNAGASGSITASADTGGTMLPVIVSVCQTNPATGACLATPAPSVTTQINAGSTPTFGVFVQATGAIPFSPATNRVYLRFQDPSGLTRGATSVAIRTQ